MIYKKKVSSKEISLREKLFWDEESKKSLSWVSKIRKKDFLFEVRNKPVWWNNYIDSIRFKFILDVGCGTENHIPYFVLSKNKVVGMDLSENTINVNKTLLDKLGIKTSIVNSNNPINIIKLFKKKKNSNVILVEGNIEYPIFLRKQFDVVHAKWVLHHTQSIPTALKNINLSLKRGGLFLCTESNLLYPLRWITQVKFLRSINIFRYLAIKYGPLDPYEMAETPWSYVNMIKNAGFRIHVVDFKYEFELVRYIIRLFIKNKQIIHFAEKIDNLLLLLGFPKYFAMDVKILAEKVKDV